MAEQQDSALLLRRIERMERLLPYVLAVVLTGIGLAISTTMHPEKTWILIVSQTLFFMIILLSIWHLNGRYLLDLSWKTIAANAMIITAAAATNHHFISAAPWYVSVIRLLMPTVLFVSLQWAFRTFRERMRLERENLQLRAENYRAELENLKKQLNPHFLFNSLSTLQALVRSDGALAEQYIVQLSDLYRHILRHSERERIALSEELQIVRAYIFLQQTRFEEGLHCEIAVSDEALNYQIPAFALQLLVENCIKHNIVSSEQPLHIRIFQPHTASICVENNLQRRRTPASSSTALGLENLRRRYELLRLPDGVQVSENTEKSTFAVTLKLF